ncbi:MULTISPECIES: hypothetical protein [Methylobacterium]|uniref:DNA packaging protein n=1 Tax=Methylobacterium ajmalii TaxID=2738439 RepID=A0ABU9ZM74_9HYPH|nr:hypothetical protein [Methylobacterium aquaticum]
MPKTLPTPDDECSGADLATLLGISERTLRDLAAAGHVVKSGRSRYRRDASITAYCAHLRGVASGRGGDAAVTTLTAERARLAREQADTAAIKRAALTGALIPAADVERRWRQVLASVRTRLMGVPSRVRQHLPHLTPTDVAALDRELRDALTELATDADA